MKELFLKLNEIFKKKELILWIIFILGIAVAFNLGMIVGSKMYSEPSIFINCP